MVLDRYLADEPLLYPYIKWDRLDKMQAIRVATRNKSLLKYIDLKRYNYRIKEIFFFIKDDYDSLFKYFNFSFDNLVHEDVYFLLCLGQYSFLDSVNISEYKFNFIELLNIIKAFDCDRQIIEKINYKDLKNYQVSEALIMGGEDVLDLFDTNILNTLDWLDLLQYRPEFLKYCDFEKFIKGDPFNLIQLITLFESPDLSYLLNSIDIKDITPFGWEKLLVSNPEKFATMCDFSKLNENNWNVILSENPELKIYKN